MSSRKLTKKPRVSRKQPASDCPRMQALATQDAPDSPSSLPLTVEGAALPTSDAKSVPTGKVSRQDRLRQFWKLPKNSKVKKTALRVVAMKQSGLTYPEIAKALNITAGTARMYVYRAGKNGWLRDDLDDPRDIIDYQLVHKSLRNLDQALDSDDEARRTGVALEIAKGTIFKTYDQQGNGPTQSMTVLSVQIEMPEGASQKVREGAVVGAPNYIDAEVTEGT